MKNLMWRVAALSVLMMTPALRADDDAKGCSVETLKGAFGYTVRGTTPANTQFAAVGRLVFNGKGLVTTVRTLSNAGTIVRNDTGAGTYSLDGDCRGSFSIGASGLGQLQVDIVVSADGAKLQGIVTNPGFVLTLDGTREKK